VLDFGIPVLQVKGSNLFNLRERAVKEHADLFGDRLYSVEVEDDEFVMRYAACHAQFAMVRDWVITYKQLPFGVFEIADSYRLEQRGETLLCFRMRRFFMPDFHVFCRDVEEAKNWFSTIHEKIYSEIEKAGGDYEMLFNFSSEDEYIKSREWILSLLRRKGKPALLHFYPPGKKYYWTVNVEYCIIDEQKRPMEIATVQIDVGNAERFGISYIDKDGERKRPVIIHTAVIGSIERYLYAIFDFAIKARKRTGLIQIPLWLNPEQVRIVPIGESHLKRAIEIAELMERRNIRVGIDDRNETINKKVREAKMDWVNYVIVIGDKEVKSDKVPVYVREKNANIEMNVESLIKEIEEKTNGMPFRPMYIPREMSKRPIY
jgi:threonyl-tRNA synthetase